MNSKNNYIRDFVGVTAWHNAGYTGSRVHALTGERLEGFGATEHGQLTRLAFLEIAPDATLTYAPLPTASNTAPEFLELKGDACVMFTSLSVTGANGCMYADPVIPDDIFISVSAGNEGSSSSNGWIRAEKIYGVGAVDLRWSAMRNGEPLPGAELLVLAASYSSESEHVDFGSPTDLYTEGSYRFNGTSCAAPTLAGMAALVNDFFIDKTGKPLTHQMMYQFFKDNCMDIEYEGKDVVTGWGLPILPPPETIDIKKYQTDFNDEPEEDLNAPYGRCGGCGEPLSKNGSCIEMQGPICDGWIEEPEVCVHASCHIEDFHNPSCTSDGFTTYACEDCRYTWDDYTPALGHLFENGYCVRCGEIDVSYTEPEDSAEPQVVMSYELFLEYMHRYETEKASKDPNSSGTKNDGFLKTILRAIFKNL